MSDHSHQCPICGDYWPCAVWEDVCDDDGTCRDCLDQKISKLTARAELAEEILARVVGWGKDTLDESDLSEIQRLLDCGEL